MELLFKITFLRGQKIQAVVQGAKLIDGMLRLTVGDLDKIVATEQLLERLTGYRVHIESEVLP